MPAWSQTPRPRHPAVVAVGILAADASAVYHPSMGRFLQRDPGSGAGSPVRVGAAGPVKGRGFVPRDSAGQYRDGMNLYQYVRSNPGSFIDPSGLKAYTILVSPPGLVSWWGKLWQDTHDNLGELIDNTKALLGADKEDCISTLEIEGHSNWNGMDIGPTEATDDNSKTLSTNTVSNKNASYVGDQLAKLKFCCPCWIILSGCNAGNLKGENTWPKVIADRTGCMVLTPMGYMSGTVFDGDARVVGKANDGTGYKETTRRYGPRNSWRLFVPKKKRTCDPCNVWKAPESAPDPTSPEPSNVKK